MSEAETAAAQRWAAMTLRLVVEPGGAVALAALLAGKIVPEPGMLVLLSGGNVDLEAYANALAAERCTPAEAGVQPGFPPSREHLEA